MKYTNINQTFSEQILQFNEITVTSKWASESSTEHHPDRINLKAKTNYMSKNAIHIATILDKQNSQLESVVQRLAAWPLPSDWSQWFL